MIWPGVMCFNPARGFRFRKHHAPLPGRRLTVDVAFPLRRVAVFVDGCFWHGCPVHGTWPKANAGFWRAKIEANRRRDRRVDEELREAGWRVVRVWECEDVDVAVRRVVEALSLDPHACVRPGRPPGTQGCDRDKRDR